METRFIRGRTVLISSLTRNLRWDTEKSRIFPNENKLVKPFELILNILVIPNDK